MNSRVEIVTDADITDLSTFRLPARAAELAVIQSPEQISALPPAEKGELILGGGSNTLFVGDWPGRILLNRLAGISFETNGNEVLVTAAAGESWHRLVRTCIDRGLHGLENLIMIPGSVGAAPMQNIGAYGLELSRVFESLAAWDRTEQRMTTLARADCAFGYRDSYFKSVEPGRYLITSVTLRLSRQFRPDTRYASLADALRKAGIEQPSARQLVATVMRLRRHRLPDPARLANAGSFFKNPVVDSDTAAAVLAEHPDLPHWPMSDARIKLGAGRMIELLGWKGKSVGDAAVYPNHALVLINRGQATAADLLELVGQITASVEQAFGVRLEVEPRLVGRG
jgi:UDP-N-acetylmuramate dehydrogenase